VNYRPIFVTTDIWNVSYETPHTTPDGEPATRLNLFFVAHDEPNELGGNGVIYRHPCDGLLFASVDEASWWAYEHGFLWVWAWSHAKPDKLDTPFGIAPTPQRHEGAPMRNVQYPSVEVTTDDLERTKRAANTTVPFRLPGEYDPQYLTCERQGCRFVQTRQRVVGVWDQPAHFVDPSTIFLLRCGHEVM
jgi:hypothetical protein